MRVEPVREKSAKRAIYTALHIDSITRSNRQD